MRVKNFLAFLCTILFLCTFVGVKPAAATADIKGDNAVTLVNMDWIEYKEGAKLEAGRTYVLSTKSWKPTNPKSLMSWPVDSNMEREYAIVQANDDNKVKLLTEDSECGESTTGQFTTTEVEFVKGSTETWWRGQKGVDKYTLDVTPRTVEKVEKKRH